MLVLLSCLGLGLCLYAALNDVATLTIPNWLNLSLALLGLSALAVAGLGLEAILWHLGVALLAFAVSFGLFVLGVWGGGDAKMVPAVLLWLGPLGVVPFFYWMALSGGVLALILILARKAVPQDKAPKVLSLALKQGAGVPYGVAIAVGVFMAVPTAPLFSDVVSMVPALH